jgi:hypothetical protein
MPHPPATFGYRRLLPIACGMPAVLATVNYFVLQRFLRGEPSILETTLTFALFVFQIGCVGVIAGRYIPVAWLRWTLFGWTLLLINLQICLVTNMQGARGRYWELEIPCLAAALFSGQVGFAAVWGVFGIGRWYWRCPAMLGLTLLLTTAWMTIETLDAWTVAFITQAVAVVAICAPLRFVGFHLQPLDGHSQLAAVDAREPEPLQFQIRHVLGWTTGLAILLGLAKGLDLLNLETLRRIVRPEVAFVSSLALASAIVIVVALWAALGQGSRLMRYSVLVFATMAVGGSIAGYCAYWIYLRQSNLVRWSELFRWYNIEWWWLAWTPLSAGFLVASLLILRTTHYRLVKQRRRVALRCQ